MNNFTASAAAAGLWGEVFSCAKRASSLGKLSSMRGLWGLRAGFRNRRNTRARLRVSLVVKLPRFMWAPKSLVIGAAASGVDLAIGTFCAVVFQLPTSVCTACGLVVGASLNFLAQRRFAFGDRDTRLGRSGGRWLLVTACQILLHGQLVTLLRDGLGVPYVPAKMAGDLVVFTALQLVLLRYVIFPARSAPQTA